MPKCMGCSPKVRKIIDSTGARGIPRCEVHRILKGRHNAIKRIRAEPLNSSAKLGDAHYFIASHKSVS